MNSKRHYFNALGIFLIAFTVLLAACSSKEKKVVAEIGDEKIYLADFENQYLKTVNSLDSARSTTIEQRKEFLDLLIKFRLKVKDARERGLLNSPDIQKDLNDYKKNFVSSYYIDKHIVEPNIKQLYERKQYEIRASHILINLPEKPTPEDSTKAYDKAKQVLERLDNDEDFAKVAMEMSDDPSAKTNAGDLYYFTGGMTVPEFEDAVYKINVGDYSKEPIRTVFGLHIVKVTDKKKRNESVRASHIMIQDARDSAGAIVDSIGGYNKAKQLYDRLKSGEDFAALAKEFSMDPTSSPNGGDLGYFDRRRMVQTFDSAAFSMEINEISEPIRTPYGWHIIKLTDIKEYEPFERQKEKLKTEYKRSAFYRNIYNDYLTKARDDMDFKLNQTGISLLLDKMDSTKTFNNHNFDSLFSEADRQVVAAEFDGGNVKIGDIVQHFNNNKDLAATLGDFNGVNELIKTSAEMPLLNAAAMKEGVEKEEDYKNLLAEYENGLLSFKIDQEELWSKIKLDETEMQNFYAANKERYQFVENNETKYRAYDEVKAEISNILQQDRFKQMEADYVDRLKQKYPIVVKEDVLKEAFVD